MGYDRISDVFAPAKAGISISRIIVYEAFGQDYPQNPWISGVNRIEEAVSGLKMHG